MLFKIKNQDQKKSFFPIDVERTVDGALPKAGGLITKTLLFKYIENFTTKNWKFLDKKFDIFFLHISTQNIDCGYSLEPPLRGGSNEYPQSMF